MVRKLCAMMLAVALESACAMNPRTHSFVELPKYLKPGDTINLIEWDHERTTGQVQRLTPTSMIVMTRGKSQEIAESRIARIERRERRLARGLVTGGFWGAVGPLVPLAFWLGLGEGQPNDQVVTIAYFKVVGPAVAGTTFIGAIIGLVAGSVKKPRPVYQSPLPLPISPATPAPSGTDAIGDSQGQGSPHPVAVGPATLDIGGQLRRHRAERWQSQESSASGQRNARRLRRFA